jgi:LppX_LprAFG lipoprotein
MRRLLPVLLICAVAALGAGCGAEKSVKDAVDPVAQAATRTADAGTVQLAITGKVSAAGQEVPLSGKGAFDLKGKRGRMTVTTNVPGQGDVEIEERIDGLVLYLRSEALSANLPGGKHWVKVDLKALSRKQGIDLGQLEQLGGGTDPTQFLSYLKKTADVTKVGSEDIDGTPTTHYRATIDLDKVADSAGDAAESVRQLQKLSGQKTIPTDVWIDAEGRARRQSVAYSAQQPVPMRIQFTIDYEKFGVPVDVEAPDDGDTVDLADIIGG